MCVIQLGQLYWVRGQGQLFGGWAGVKMPYTGGVETSGAPKERRAFSWGSFRAVFLEPLFTVRRCCCVFPTHHFGTTLVTDVELRHRYFVCVAVTRYSIGFEMDG